MAVWERCLAASEAKDITPLSVLLALLGLGLQLFAVATALLEACVLRREGLLGLLGLVALEHKGA